MQSSQADERGGKTCVDTHPEGNALAYGAGCIGRKRLDVRLVGLYLHAAPDVSPPTPAAEPANAFSGGRGVPAGGSPFTP